MYLVSAIYAFFLKIHYKGFIEVFALEREILAQRMTLKIVVSIYPAKIGMIRKRHAEHVVYLPFEQVGSGPEIAHRIDAVLAGPRLH